MKAMVISGLGDPGVLRQAEVAAPVVTEPTMTLIRTEATSYNNVDALLRKEDFGLAFPIIAGTDLVGTAMSGSSEGERMIVNPGIPCGSCDRCAAGAVCRYVKILGVHSPGAYGQYVAVPKSQCFPVPEGVSLEVAAAFPLVFLTSWRMLRSRAGLESGETVLVWGATGGLGSAAISVVKALGGRSIAVTRRSAAIDQLLDFGADYVIDTSRSDLEAEIARITSGRGVDVVFEGPGAATWQLSMKVVSQGGRIVTAGVTTGSHADLDIEDLYYRQITVLGSRMGYHFEFSEVLEALSSGRVRPLISSIHGLSEARLVHESVSAGQECGKVVMIYDL